MNDLFEEACPCCKRPYDTPTQSAGFAEFWASVPHKIGKIEAEKAWNKLNPQDRKAAMDKVKPFYDWFSKTYKDASPIHPVRYLKNQRWLDEAMTGVVGKITNEAETSILKGLQSNIASVREHSERMAARHNIAIPRE